jgi:hypothetical protein
MNYRGKLITVQDVNTITPSDIVVAESIFTQYFMNLYKNTAPEMLGLNKSIALYLEEIFNKTKQAFCDGSLLLSFAYLENNIVGMGTYELLEGNIVLIRTLPIDFDYICNEQEIRAKLIEHIYERFSLA